MSDYIVFFDFDNTITHFDVFDDMIKRFSVDNRWVRFEKAWEEGKIGSKECLKNQLKSVRISKKDLLGYLHKVKVDPYFSRLLSMFKAKGVKPIILSDSFCFLIDQILRKNKAGDLKVYSNRLKFSKNRLIPSFPRRDKSCLLCAHCKKKTLLDNAIDGKIIVYIGDGRSDICPAMYADLVFAKGKLLKQLKAVNKECVGIKDLADVYRYFKEEMT